jgi:hypothetical protein
MATIHEDAYITADLGLFNDILSHAYIMQN